MHAVSEWWPIVWEVERGKYAFRNRRMKNETIFMRTNYILVITSLGIQHSM